VLLDGTLNKCMWRRRRQRRPCHESHSAALSREPQKQTGDGVVSNGEGLSADTGSASAPLGTVRKAREEEEEEEDEDGADDHTVNLVLAGDVGDDGSCGDTSLNNSAVAGVRGGVGARRQQPSHKSTPPSASEPRPGNSISQSSASPFGSRKHGGNISNSSSSSSSSGGGSSGNSCGSNSSSGSAKTATSNAIGRNASANNDDDNTTTCEKEEEEEEGGVLVVNTCDQAGAARGVRRRGDLGGAQERGARPALLLHG